MLAAVDVKTSYSMLSSLNKISMLTEKARELGYFSLAITDINNMFGAYEFYLSCQKNNIKPLIGMEIKNIKYNFILLCKNNYGYKNLIKLATIISDEEKIIDIETLKNYSDNLILIIKNKNLDKNIIDIYSEYYVSYNCVDSNNISDDRRIISNSVSYINKEDHKYLDYLLMIRDELKLGQFELNNNKNKYLLNKDEYLSLNDIVSLKNIEKIVNSCNVTFQYQEGLLPVYDKNIDANKYLKELALKGLNKRLNGNISSNYLERLEYELKIINQMGFSNYFLVVWDYVKYAKFNNILVGPGRGSASGSLVSYAIGITEVDPIKYNLLFERFLNPERVTMPDIDVDFDSEKRGCVVDYVINKYGEKNVAGIITFNTLGAKQVIRDVGKVLNISQTIIDNLTKNITYKTLKETIENEKKFVNLIESNNNLKKLLDISLKLEGLPRHISVHAAGIVMSNKNIDDIIPLYKSQIGTYVTGFSKDYLEPLGLLKMDFLGIDNLTLISNVIKDIKEKEKINISFNKIPLDDKKTLKIFYDVDTDGIFQFESPGMKRFLAKLKIKSFDDITLALALYRPGPMENIDTFVKRREGIIKTDYIVKELEGILKPTYGVIVYQEQIMQIVRVLAGYSYGEADILRRAMSKKNEDIIIKERPKFIQGATKNGYSKEIANKIYDLILKFANYGFNKSHSVAYAMIAYKMAFIKTYFPKYFLNGLLNNEINNEKKINLYINEARKRNIKIIAPDINKSKNSFYVYEDKILCPLSIIRNIGSTVSYDIVKEREKGPYKDFCDFILRIYGKGINRKVITSLIEAGCINFGYNKKTLINNLDNIINYAEIAKDSGLIEIEKPIIEEYKEYDKNYLISLEHKAFGFYLTEHPISKYKSNVSVSSINIEQYFNRNINMILIVSKIKEVTTKNNDIMAFVNGEDEYGCVSLTLFPNVYKIFNSIKINSIIEITGKVERRYDKYQIIVNNIKLLEELK